MDEGIFDKTPYQRRLSRPFFRAVKNSNLEEIKNLVKKDQYLVFERDFAEETCLHWAAKRDYTDIMLFTILQGANVNAFDMGGRTPLFIAARNGHLESVKILLAHKCNPSLRSF